MRICFFLLDHGKYKAVIPSLLSAVEHELAINTDNNDIGQRLIRRLQYSLEEGNNGGFRYAVGISVASLLANGLFMRHSFNEERVPLINRNWILHGRDDPSKWIRIDVYKLITVISALKLIQKD
ncbi:hypothetical protein [Paenibacillus sp. E194]|uniref:hypothetical protein n=1 Tax=Paenibacillus sp. E194 TaxID=1458845 RepID=UPI0012E088BF|nr:hypothetical protein [Paenibacillus sp. E194]